MHRSPKPRVERPGPGVCGRLDEAMELIGEVRDTTHAIEPAVLIPAVEAVCAPARRATRRVSIELVPSAVRFRRAQSISSVTTYRACPELLSVFFGRRTGECIRELVERVGDGDLAAAVDIRSRRATTAGVCLLHENARSLSSCEMAYTNRQIAKLLFIEESTVKVHAHHIYDKLGVRSRSALTVQAALERSAHATSAIESHADRGLVVALRELREVLAFCEPVVLVGAREDRLEGCDCGRVELAVDRLGKSETCDSTRHRVAVRPVGRHRVVGVGDRDDPRYERDVVVDETVRIALTVDSLVVMADDPSRSPSTRHVGEDALSDRRVLLHLAALLERERAGLFEESRRKADLPDVVDEATEVRLVAHLVGESHALGDVARVDRDSGRVAGRVPVSRVEGRDQRGGKLEVRALERFVDFGRSAASCRCS